MIVTTTDRELRLVLSVEECGAWHEGNGPEMDKLILEVSAACAEVLAKVKATANERQRQAEADAKAAESCPIKVGMQVTSDAYGVGWRWFQVEAVRATGKHCAIDARLLRADGKLGHKEWTFYTNDESLQYRPAGSKDEEDGRSLKEIAAAIRTHLKHEVTQNGRLSGAFVEAAGARILYRHRPYYSPERLTKRQAVRWLSALDANPDVFVAPWEVK